MGQATAGLDPETRDFYVRTLAVLDRSGVPFLVGGAYALARHAGIERHTKDLDVFVRRVDRDRMLGALGGAGFRTELAFPHWLAKAHGDRGFVDLIYSSGCGMAEVDDGWFAHAVDGEVFGVAVRLCPAEEMIWSKGFIQERERFDGADIAHSIRARGESLDWARLVRRFGDRWRVLLGHLVAFGFIYPSERDKVPPKILGGLIERLKAEIDAPPPTDRVCFGTILSREQYLVDVEAWGYQDARLQPRGPMTPEEVAHWTAAIGGH